ncbi:DNA polymerase II, large subunit DP2, partial [mine drainage metagenome]
MESYFRRIEASVDRAYAVAEAARRKGLDPTLAPEIPRAQDMAGRVEKLLAHLDIAGISEEIRALAERMPREEVAVEITRRLARDETRAGGLVQRVDAALRVGLAILTEGILVAPLEGLAEVRLTPGPDGTPFIELHYAGPIRAAGGTAQALSVLLADIVRRDLGLAPYRPEHVEVERYKEEIPLYKFHQHLQYVPSAHEIEIVVRHVPVCISGEATEGDAEVSAWRNLPRVGTNGIRGGACLVIAEGLCQKSAKLQKIVEKLQIPDWEFLTELGHSRLDDDHGTPKYLTEAVGGRPILAHPGRPGGFRLVYGRARTTGLAACAVNPATMIVLHNFVAVGTQVKLEYPGKASAMGLCDLVEGPIVELDDGTLTAINDAPRARELVSRIHRIVDIGELLVSFGEFLENNRPLAPGAYTLDWHREELRAAGAPLEETLDPPSYEAAVEVGHTWGVPLHPRWLLFWHDLTSAEIRAIGEFVERCGNWRGGALELPWDVAWREVLVRLGFLHYRTAAGAMRGNPDASAALVGTLGLGIEGGLLLRQVPLDPLDPDPLSYASRLARTPRRARAPSRSRGAHRSAGEGPPAEHEAERACALPHRRSRRLPAFRLPSRARDGQDRRERSPRSAPVRDVRPTHGLDPMLLRYPHRADGRGAEPTVPRGPDLGRGAPGSPPETDARGQSRQGPHLSGQDARADREGILRAHHGISVYQDGTARFDLTDLPLTHFRPHEIGTDIATLQGLGYTSDWTGAPLVSIEQLVELAPQDMIVSRSCGEYLLHLAQFVDDELVQMYHGEAFYRAAGVDAIRGALVVALAPHTSGGVAGRIIGFTEAEACFAHPIFHAAKRRNCDGDEDSVTLLLDALLNFSRAFLPDSRGALMDKPLVLTTRLNATEV